jgi:hypothetical protein
MAKIIRSKSWFVYEGTKTSEEDKNEDDQEDIRAAAAMGMRRRRQRGAANTEREKSELNPQELMEHLRATYREDPELMNHLFPVFREDGVRLAHPTDLLFIQILPVPPPR